MVKYGIFHQGAIAGSLGKDQGVHIVAVLGSEDEYPVFWNRALRDIGLELLRNRPVGTAVDQAASA